MMRQRSIVFTILLSLLLVSSIIISGCQGGAAVPKQKTMIVEANPGGVLDTMFRGIAPYFQKYIGATVIIENRPVASGTEARNYVWSQPPDGNLIISLHSSSPMYMLLYGPRHVFDKPYLEAFIPVASWMNAGGTVLATPKDSPIKTFDDFSQAAKQRKLILGIGTLGSDEHVNAVILEKQLGVEFTMIPFESSGESLAAVLGGHIDAALADVGAEAMSEESFNMLGIASSERFDAYPNMPTFKDLGFPELDLTFHVGGAVREGTPENIVNELEAAYEKAFYDPGFQNWAKSTKKPIGEFWGREKYTDYMKTWFKQNEEIYPSIKEAMEKAAG